MDVEVPYMPSVKNLHRILDAIQNAGAPDAFGLDFLKDLGFTSSNDRSVIKLLKYLGFLDGSGKPLGPYREFMDHTKAKKVLAARVRHAYDDLFLADKDADARSAEKLKGWFKTKTGQGDAVAKKMATTFRSLAGYADFSALGEQEVAPSEGTAEQDATDVTSTTTVPPAPVAGSPEGPALTFRVEVNLPDTTNVDTYRAIFKALREELLG